MHQRFHVALATTIGVHVLVLYGLVSGLRPSFIHEARRVALVVQLTPEANHRGDLPASASAPTVKERKATPVTMEGPTKERLPKDIRSTPPASTASPVITTEQQVVEPNAAPLNLSADEILQNSRNAIGKIDRELRQAYPVRSPIDKPLPQSRFEQALSAAGVQRSLDTETIVLADGRRMTKVKGPNGTYCVISEVNNGADGRDSMKDGVRSKTVNCPS
ncbi:hypothetical protein BH11PSE11_BH11PSE11_19740 [soil metagenome]